MVLLYANREMSGKTVRKSATFDRHTIGTGIDVESYYC